TAVNPSFSRALTIFAPDRTGSLGILVNVERGDQRRPAQCHRELLQVQLDSLAEIGARIDDVVALRSRARIRVVSDIAALCGGRENRGYSHRRSSRSSGNKPS